MNAWKALFTTALAVAIPALAGAEQQARDRNGASACFRPDERSGRIEAAPCDRKLLEASAGKGEVYAQNQLGLVSALLVDNRQELQRARDWFQKAARRGYAPAQVNLAVLYLN